MRNDSKKVLIVILVIIISFVLFSNLSGYFIYQKSETICPDCNVIVIILDALRPDHLGCYGYFRNTSPNIDELTKESILFKTAFSQSSHTLASHMSIFTSQYPSTHNIIEPLEDISLNPNTMTLTQILKMNDYTTVWIGPLYDENLDLKRGFERGFDYFFNIELEKKKTYYWKGAVDWIEENENKKFFMFLYNFKIHDPYTPLMESVLKFTDMPNKKIISSDIELFNITTNKIISNPSIIFKDSVIKENQHLFSNKTLLRYSLPFLCKNYSNLHRNCFNLYEEMFWKNINLSDDSDINYIKLLYDSEIYEADQDVKKLIDLLKREKLMDKTILIITSDHGEEFMEHGRVDHGATLYDEVTHVPLIIWIPNVKGKEVSSLVQGIDIMPTILDLIGIDSPKQVQGVSLLPLIEGGVKPLNKYIYTELFGYLASIRSTNWKYITNFKKIEELYNLDKDPIEKNNLIKTEPEIAEHMKNKLEDYFNEIIA